jgi:hypothetical protein
MSTPTRCTHRNCANCSRFALHWCNEVCRLVDQPMLFAPEAA